MIEKYYEDAPDQFKSAWLNENNPKGLIEEDKKITYRELQKKSKPSSG